MPLTKDRWPNIYFYDVRQTKQVKVNVKDCKLKSGSTKGHGPGKYFQIIAMKPGRLDYNLYKFISEDSFTDLSKKMKGGKVTSKKSPSACNRNSRTGKKKSKKQCSGKSCSWVKGRRASGKTKSRKGYCRRSPK